MPISADELRDLRDLIKRIDTIIQGYIAQADADAGRIVPQGEPPARVSRLR